MTAFSQTSPRPPCPDATPLLHQYVDGEVREPQLRDVKSHLASCPECQSYVVILREEIEALQQATMGPDGQWNDLWDHRLRRKLAIERLDELGFDLLQWLVATTRLQAIGDASHPLWRQFGDALPQIPWSADECTVRMERALRHPDFEFPNAECWIARLRAGQVDQVLRQYEQVAGPDAPALHWCRVFRSIAAADLAAANANLRRLWQTPGPLMAVMRAWVEGQPVPLPDLIEVAQRTSRRP